MLPGVEPDAPLTNHPQGPGPSSRAHLLPPEPCLLPRGLAISEGASGTEECQRERGPWRKVVWAQSLLLCLLLRAEGHLLPQILFTCSLTHSSLLH